MSGVSFSYGTVPALRGIDINLNAGETIAVLGANGTGKSTLLKLLNGLLFPDSGSIVFKGRKITEESLSGAYSVEFRSSVGFVFSEPDVQLFCATVYDEVAFGPLQLGFGPDEVALRTEETLELLGLTGLSDRTPHSLSSGEKKKVAIATVLVTNPAVILMDEPTLGLDPRTQRWLLGLIGVLKATGKTFILSTHDLKLVGEIADRVVLLNEANSVEHTGDTATILADTKLLFKANIIGDPAAVSTEVGATIRL